LGTILRLQRAVGRNRWRALGRLGQLGVLAGLVGAVVGLVLAGDALLRPGDLEGLERRVELWAFWCMTAAALIFGYTSFDVLYRDEAASRLMLLPVRPEAMFVWKVIKVYCVHLPLVLLPVASGFTLITHGQVAAWGQGVGACLGALVWGLAAAIYAHMWAGQSLLDEATKLKGYMASGFGPPETAFLFYSPAMALVGALSVGILCDLGLTTGVTRGIWGPMIVVGGALTVAAGVALVTAQRIFVADHHKISPRFADAEVLPPWREGALPRHYFGEELGRYLPASAQPVWRRDILQYRRRFRVVLPLLFVAAAVLAIYALNTADTPGGPLRTALVAMVLGVTVFTPVFRLAGPELGTRYDSRALAVDPADERRVQWALALTEWGPIGLVAAAASLLAGFGIATLGVIAAVLAAFFLTNAVAIPLALRAAPNVAGVSMAVKGGMLLLMGGASALAQALGA